MANKSKKTLSLLLLTALLLSACGKAEAMQENPVPAASFEPSPEATEETTEGSIYFSNRDHNVDYDENSAVLIKLSGTSASCDSAAVSISGGEITVKEEGTYLLRGSLTDGMVIVDADKSEKIQLVLDSVDICSSSSAPLYIRQADKVFVTLAPESENKLSNGGSFVAVDENDIDAALYSKEDITLNGSGSLSVNSPAGHGIVSKDSLTISGGSYDINSSGHALSGKDDVCIADGSFSIISGKDGIHAENNDDAELGYVYIENGSFDISSEGDGISAASYVQLLGGSFSITSGGGSENAEQKDSFPMGAGFGKGFGGGMGPGGGGMRPGRGYGGGFDAAPQINEVQPETEEESISTKGIKAGTELSISGGAYSINSADDAIHSSLNAEICGGSFEIASGDDAIHAEEKLSVSDGDISISQCYEGLEALHILVSDGNISLVANDDGFNAAGGMDQSGMGGRDAQMPGGMGYSSNGSVVISGGNIFINASGDGIDANGSLEISGGYTIVTGPTQGDTATLDYDTSAVISGGTFIGTGAYGMAQTFSDSENQGVIAVSVGNQSPGTEIRLSDEDGNIVLSHTPELNFCVVILSSPDIIKGQPYTLSLGSISETFEAY